MEPRELDANTLSRVMNLLRERTALKVSVRHAEALSRLLLERMGALKLSLDQYLAKLASEPSNTGELAALSQELTVGETYFFRGPIYPVLRKTVLPELIKSNGRLRRIRALSAGCATGEEAYSLAVVLKEAVPANERWELTVVGVDLNERFLRRAEEGRFGDWSMREMPADEVQKYFVRDQGRHQIKPELRSLVQFKRSNLALDPLPDPSRDLYAFDLIVCQNVLYYFEPEARSATRDRLVRSLAPGGWIFFGPTDVNDAEISGCRVRTFGDVVGHQRLESSVRAERSVAAVVGSPLGRRRTSKPGLQKSSTEAATPAVSRTPTPTPTPTPATPLRTSTSDSSRSMPQVRSTEPAIARRPTTSVPTQGEPERPITRRITTTQSAVKSQELESGANPRPGAISQRVSLERAVALAEQGELNLALSLIERVLLEQRDSASAHALHGWLLSERGSHDGALAAYRKALYLEETMLLAHAGAATAARRSGVLDVARRFESRARTLAKVVGEPQLSSPRWEERLAARLLLQLQSGRVK